MVNGNAACCGSQWRMGPFLKCLLFCLSDGERTAPLVNRLSDELQPVCCWLVGETTHISARLNRLIFVRQTGYFPFV